MSAASQWHGKALECRVSCAALWSASMCENPTPQTTSNPKNAAAKAGSTAFRRDAAAAGTGMVLPIVE
jgi:hypothetical protein